MRMPPAPLIRPQAISAKVRAYSMRGIPMALFRMTAAFGLLLVVAPDQTMEATRSILGMAGDKVASETAAGPASAEAALAFCRANADLCLETARRAAGVPAKPANRS